MATQLHAATRKQLDELDALLQKMLDGPGRPGEADAQKEMFPTSRAADAPPAAPRFPVPEVAYGLPPGPAFSAETAPAKPEPPNPSAWNIDLNPKSGSSVLGERSPLAEKLANGVFGEPTVAMPPLQLTAIVPEIGSTAVAGSSIAATPLWLRPAASINRRFDDWASGWGFLGRLATGRFGRTLLGWAGLAMLASSSAWLAMFWTGWWSAAGIVR